MENFDELEKAMDVKTEIVKETKSVKVKPVKNGEDDPKKDYEYSRAQLYNLVAVSYTHLTLPTNREV